MGAHAAGDRQRLMLGVASWVEHSAPGRFAGRLPPRLAPLLAGVVAAAVVAVGLLRGAPYAGGSDAYGYVSQADLWAKGSLHIEQPFVRDIGWPFEAAALTPLAYRPTPDGTAIVPIYAPGLPMLMAVFERLANRAAVFYVVPLLGGVAIWATYLLGKRYGGETVGVSAAILLATSPAFLFQLMFPMSDVPATAWWALSLALLMADGRSAALASGLAAGAAILTRPNLVPLAMIPGGLLLWRAFRARDMAGSAAQRVVLFAAGSIPACLIIAIVNTRLWGSPFATGYAPTDIEYRWSWVLPNLHRYPGWLMTTQTPAVLLALLAPMMPSKNSPLKSQFPAVTLLLGAFVAAVVVIYLLHEPNNSWFWLRYLLPAFPPLLVLMSAGLAVAFARLTRGVRLITTGLVLGLLAWHGVSFGINDGIFRFREGERKSRAVGEYIANNLPENAIFISKLHSGSIRYYSGRLTIQYEFLPPDSLDSVVALLRTHGYQPFFALEDWERPLFHLRFGSRSALAGLDWPPRALLDDTHTTKVSIYDPADRELSPQQVKTDIIP